MTLEDGEGESPGGGGRVLVLNPEAGSADHAARIRELADSHGFDVRETEAAGDAVDLARAAADEASLIAAAGGDGTVNEVVRGSLDADALSEVTLGVVPAGTGNNFAKNVGVDGIDHAFDVMGEGEVRTIDLGWADDRPFLNSCIGGLTAEASADTSAEAKARFGVLAYVLSTIRTAVEFEGLPLHIETVGASAGDWSGKAAFVLVGNGRRFPVRGSSQADMEDGLLDVTVVEDRPTVDLVGEAAVNRLLGAETANVIRFTASALTVGVTGDESGTFSLDGEMIDATAIELSVDAEALRIHVGETYDPHPNG